MHVIGLDPGGFQSFGWALLKVESSKLVSLKTGTASTARDAVTDAWPPPETPPCAVGIDAPLFWTQYGDRLADLTVRRMVKQAGGHSATVGHVNSLRGACLVQGVLAAVEVQKRDASVLVTEAHPKALLRVHTAAKSFVEAIPHTFRTDHEYDAAIAGFTAWSAFTKAEDWHDLAAIERNPYFPSGANLLYWFPRGRA